MRKLPLFLVLSLAVVGLSGCSTFSRQSPQIEANIKAASYLNPNIYNQSSPVVVTFYQLKSSTAFSQANFFALYNDPVKVLGNDLLDKREVELRPEQSIALKQILAPNTAFIGVVAAYRNPDRAQWRQLITLEPDSTRVKLSVSLETQSLTVKLT